MPLTARQGELRYRVSARGIVSYEVDVWHEGLGKNRTVRAPDASLASRMALAQCDAWNRAWSSKLEQDGKRASATALRRSREEMKQEAATLTTEALAFQEQLAGILRHTLAVNNSVDFESLKDRTAFPEGPPAPLPRPSAPVLPAPLAPVTPAEPRRSEYEPRLGLLDKLVASCRQAKERDAAAAFTARHAEWQEEKKQAEIAAAQARELHVQRVVAADAAHRKAVAAWQVQGTRLREEWDRRREVFLREQAEQNAAIDKQRERYLAGAADAAVAYCDTVLSNSRYPEGIFPQSWRMDYNGDLGDGLLFFQDLLHYLRLKSGEMTFPRLLDLTYSSPSKCLKSVGHDKGGLSRIAN